MSVDAARGQYIAGLVAKRRRHGLSQTKLAARIGTWAQMLSLWETGAAQPSRVNLAAWAKALGVAPYPESVEAVRPDCGTYRGYQMHKARSEPRCDACKDANAAYIKAWRAKTRAAA